MATATKKSNTETAVDAAAAEYKRGMDAIDAQRADLETKKQEAVIAHKESIAKHIEALTHFGVVVSLVESGVKKVRKPRGPNKPKVVAEVAPVDTPNTNISDIITA